MFRPDLLPVASGADDYRHPLSSCCYGGLSKRRPNIPWSRLAGADPADEATSESEFERVATRLKLTPDEYVGSAVLRAWAEKNWRLKFVPEKLLKEWGLIDGGPASNPVPADDSMDDDSA